LITKLKADIQSLWEAKSYVNKGGNMRLIFEHVGLVVNDMERSLQFYCDLLGLKLRSKPRLAGGPGTSTGTITGLRDASFKIAELELNENEFLELQQWLFPEGKKDLNSQRCDVGTVHLSFIVDDVMKAYNELMGKGVRFVNPPVKPSAATTGVVAVSYFLDPDGHTLAMYELEKHKEKED
jgi:catechol 2,3-dioxygenase-like lactoylglutathione lyase family enzyme